MYGDPEAIRALARRMRDQADEVREEARRLVLLLGRTRWTGMAADAARAQARERLDDLRACADRHDDAAAALVRHACEVEARRALIARAERWAGRLLEAGAELAGVLPAPGHRDWLDLDLAALLDAGVDDRAA